mmetsp:Transcript_20696/g.49353  ORF Transcript_20696/g.49353 Transcript_20696/m.49353 type:complete len:231 (-) Transcript_20696:648-1340(-)
MSGHCSGSTETIRGLETSPRPPLPLRAEQPRPETSLALSGACSRPRIARSPPPSSAALPPSSSPSARPPPLSAADPPLPPSNASPPLLPSNAPRRPLPPRALPRVRTSRLPSSAPLPSPARVPTPCLPPSIALPPLSIALPQPPPPPTATLPPPPSSALPHSSRPHTNAPPPPRASTRSRVCFGLHVTSQTLVCSMLMLIQSDFAKAGVRPRKTLGLRYPPPVSRRTSFV